MIVPRVFVILMEKQISFRKTPVARQEVGGHEWPSGRHSRIPNLHLPRLVGLV